MILDATAGNRLIWENKNSSNIIYLDFNKRLQVTPSIFGDNRHLPFKDKVFDTVFFDPPYASGYKTHFWSFANITEFREYGKWGECHGKIPQYYGIDLYKNKSHLFKYIFLALYEIFRVLKDDGMLWFKWNNFEIAFHKIHGLFDSWQKLIQLNVTDNKQTNSDIQTVWVAYEKSHSSQSKLVDWNGKE